MIGTVYTRSKHAGVSCWLDQERVVWLAGGRPGLPVGRAGHNPGWGSSPTFPCLPCPAPALILIPPSLPSASVPSQLTLPPRARLPPFPPSSPPSRVYTRAPATSPLPSPPPCTPACPRAPLLAPPTPPPPQYRRLLLPDWPESRLGFPPARPPPSIGRPAGATGGIQLRPASGALSSFGGQVSFLPARRVYLHYDLTS